MAYQRNMAKGETMRMYYSPERPQVRQTVALGANVMEDSGEPLHGGDVTARIVAPSGKAETVRFIPRGDEWGAFSAYFTPEEPGKHPSISPASRPAPSSRLVLCAGTGRRADRPARPGPRCWKKSLASREERSYRVDQLADLSRRWHNCPSRPRPCGVCNCGVIRSWR